MRPGNIVLEVLNVEDFCFLHDGACCMCSSSYPLMSGQWPEGSGSPRPAGTADPWAFGGTCPGWACCPRTPPGWHRLPRSGIPSN